MPSFGERVGARGLPVEHCRCQAINRPDAGLQRNFREPSPGRNARVGSFFRPHRGRQPNNGPAVLDPARVDRLMAYRSLATIGDDTQAVGVNTAPHQIRADRVRSVLGERLIQLGIPLLIRVPLDEPPGLLIRNQPRQLKPVGPGGRFGLDALTGPTLSIRLQRGLFWSAGLPCHKWRHTLTIRTQQVSRGRQLDYTGPWTKSPGIGQKRRG